MMDEYQRFRQRQKITESADINKMILLSLVMISVVVMAFAGPDKARPFIWYWAAFLSIFTIVCIVQDIINHRKIKKLGL